MLFTRTFRNSNISSLIVDLILLWSSSHIFSTLARKKRIWKKKKTVYRYWKHLVFFLPLNRRGGLCDIWTYAQNRCVRVTLPLFSFLWLGWVRLKLKSFNQQLVPIVKQLFFVRVRPFQVIQFWSLKGITVFPVDNFLSKPSAQRTKVYWSEK